MKNIGSRISIKPAAEKTTIVISTKIASWKEALMAAWLVCWMVCLCIFTYELFKPQPEKQKIILFVLVVFMFYYAFRIAKALAWRRAGMEFIKITDDELTYKKSIRKYGKAQRIHLDNIQEISVIYREDGSISKTIENSFWVMGGERILIRHLDQHVPVGLQLTNEDAEELVKWLTNHIQKRLKKKKEQSSDKEEEYFDF